MKFHHCLFTLSIKHEIMRFHVIVMQISKGMHKKVCCTCKVVVLPIKPIVLLTVLLPSGRQIFKPLMFPVKQEEVF